MRNDERFIGALAEFGRDPVVDKAAQLFDALPVPVQRTDFRIAGAEVDLREIVWGGESIDPRKVWRGDSRKPLLGGSSRDFRQSNATERNLQKIGAE